MISERNRNKPTVSGIGDKRADIMIVGSYPNKEDEKHGKPFSDRGGKLILDALMSNNILTSQCYVTNIIKERPYKTVKSFIDLSKKEPTISKQGEEYVRELADEIMEVKPNVILAVGALALYVLTGKKGITKYRGSILESTLVEGQKVVSILDPYMALTQYKYRYYIAFDVKRLKDESLFPDLDYTPREYIIRPLYKQCIDYLNECLTKDHGFDIEVSNEEVSCISFSYDKHHAISIPFIHKYQPYFSVEQETEIWKLINKVLSNPNTKSIAQNASFDGTFLYRKYGIVPKNLHDTMIAQALLYPEFEKGLDFITTQYTDIPYYKDDGKHVIKGHESGDEQFWIYNAKDSIVLMEALPKQLNDLERMGNLETYEYQRQLLEPILFMTEWGIRMDVEGMKKESERLKHEMDRILKELETIAKQELNPNSPKQLKEYFYKKKKIKPYVDKGKPTTNEGAMKRLSRRGFKEAALILEYRKLRKLDGTYFNMLLDKDGRLRSSINPVGTKFGRLSSSKNIFGTGGNIQNIPSVFKKYMLMDEDYIGYDIDLSQAENRIVAYLGPEPNMIRAFETGEDIHSKTASYIFNKEPSKISREKGSTQIGNGDRSERDVGKQSNHSLNYRMGYRSFAYHWEMAENDGQAIREKYLQVYPGVKKMWRWIENEISSNRTLTNLMGRRMTFRDRWGDTMLKEATAFIPQSTVADKINRHGVLEVYNKQSKYPEVVLLNQVHDSIVFQIPKSVGWERHAEILQDIKKTLELPLDVKGRVFKIPAEVQMLPVNFKDGPEVDYEESITDYANELERAYNNFIDNERT